MATCSSILAKEIPRTEEPGGLQFAKESQNIGHDLAIEHQHKHEGLGGGGFTERETPSLWVSHDSSSASKGRSDCIGGSNQLWLAKDLGLLL